MNRIDQLFQDKSEEILSVYITAGYPALNDTAALLRSLAEYGADMIEIGMPFSDPLADGPVIQQSSQLALQNGMNLELLFQQLQTIRESVDIPLILMGYLNPVLKMGMEAFLKKCKHTGIDGVILPDLPPDEYEADYLELFRSYGIHHTLLITPYTEAERVKRIAGLSGGFLYLVADAATTGTKSSLASHQTNYFKRIQDMNLDLPSMIGFGISSNETFKIACSFARGAIIGSAFIRALGEADSLSLDEKVKNFIQGIRGEWI